VFVRSLSSTWIVLTASCDMDQRSVHSILLAEVRDATPTELKVSEKQVDTVVEIVRQGADPRKFLLAPLECIVPPFPLSVAFIRNQVLMPRPYLESLATSSRLRLRHPVREQFGNVVGSVFSRVGPENQVNIPKMTKAVAPEQKLAQLDREEPGFGM